MEKNVQLKYRLYRRRNGVFYWQENDSPKQGTLRTNDRREAERLLNAMNESHREPTLNLNLARAYLAAHDPRMAKRTWQAAMDEMATHGIPSTQARCARGFRSKAYAPIRNKPLVQTTGEDLLAIVHANGNCVAHYLRRLHNLALDLGWLAWPILAKRAWPKIRSQSKRAITAEEHRAVIASEKNSERRAYYELLYETGAAQSDAANLTAEDIDWENGVLIYRRKKLGPLSEPCRLTIGKKLRELLTSLPSSGDLFPTSNGFPRIIARRNFAGGAELLESPASVCIHIGTPGRSVRRLVDTRSDLRRNHSDITAALCMKLTPRVR